MHSSRRFLLGAVFGASFLMHPRLEAANWGLIEKTIQLFDKAKRKVEKGFEVVSPEVPEFFGYFPNEVLEFFEYSPNGKIKKTDGVPDITENFQQENLGNNFSCEKKPNGNVQTQTACTSKKEEPKFLQAIYDAKGVTITWLQENRVSFFLYGFGAVAVITIAGVTYVLYKNGTLKKVEDLVKRYPYRTSFGFVGAVLSAVVLFLVYDIKALVPSYGS